MTWKVGQVLYRARGTYYNIRAHTPEIAFEEWTVVKLTPKGAWLSRYPDLVPGDRTHRTWRAFDTRFASATKEEAKECALQRAYAWRRHILRRLKTAEERIRSYGGHLPGDHHERDGGFEGIFG